MFSSCTENYSNGHRIGTINKFSKSGLMCKSWEGHMNLTQTGMTSTAADFPFSLDNDNEPIDLAKTIDSAMNFGWKVELNYHEVYFKNWFSNRGSTDYFVTQCKVIDRNFSNMNMRGIINGQAQDNKATFVVNLTIDQALKMGFVDSNKAKLFNK